MKSKHAVILVVFLTLVLPIIVRAQDTENQEGPEQVAYVSLIEGEVGYQRGDDDGQWNAAAVNTPLMPGDSLYANDRGRAEIQLGDGNFLRLGTQGYVGLLQSDDQTVQFKVVSGTVTLRLHRLDRTYEIDTPNLAFTVLRSGEYRVDVSAEGDTQLTLHKGRGIASAAEQGEQELAAPARLNVINGSTEFAVSRRVKRDDWDRWNRRRDRLVYSARPRYIPYGVYGYESMRGYGRWMHTGAYGPVWIPAMGPGWQPYRLGRWVWVDPFGWTWVSYEPWGWAPYHYGRWAYVAGIGWAWVPGRPTMRQRFAAALVAFLTGDDGGGWLGWFPLGPGEIYYPYHTREVYVVRPVRQYVNYNYVTIVNRTEIYNSRTVVYNTRIVDKRVIERTKVISHCNIPPSRETLYTPAVRVKGNQVVAISNVSRPAPRPSQQIIVRNVHVRTSGAPSVRKFDEKLAEMQRSGVVRPVSPYHPRDPAAAVKREQGTSPDVGKGPIGKPVPPGHVERHGRPVGFPAGPIDRDVATADSSEARPDSGPAGTTKAPTDRGRGPSEERRTRYQPPASLEGRMGQPRPVSRGDEEREPKYRPPREVERRISLPRPGGEQAEPKFPSGQGDDRRVDHSRPDGRPHRQARPTSQPPQEVERDVNHPPAPATSRQEPRHDSQDLRPVEAQANPSRSEPAEPKRFERSSPPPPAPRAQESVPAESSGRIAPHRAPQAGNDGRPAEDNDRRQPPRAAANTEPRPQNNEVRQAEPPRPPKAEPRQKSSEDEEKEKEKEKGKK